MKNFYQLIMFLLPFYGLAQTGVPNLNVSSTNSLDNTRVINTLQQLTQKEYKPTLFNSDDVKGSPYFDEEFQSVKVYVNKDDTPISYMARYNVYDNNFELKNEDGSISSLLKVDFATIETQFGNFKALDAFDERAVIVKQYFEVLIDLPERKLLRKYSKSLKKGRPAKTSYDVSKDPEIVTKTSIYLKEGLEAPKEIKAVKEILELFPKYTEEQLKAMF